MAATAFRDPAWGKTQAGLFPHKKAKMQKGGIKIAVILDSLKNEMDFLYNNFDFITDPILVDGCIYEIMALHMKYQYYLKLCKNGSVVLEDE